MNNLLTHETKKLFTRKILLFSVALLLLANGFNIYKQYDIYHDIYNKDTNDARWLMYETVEGEITQEKVNELLSYQKELMMAQEEGRELDSYYLSLSTDLICVNNLLEDLENTYGYSERKKNILETNDGQMKIYEKVGNDYLVKKAALVSDTYSNRTIDSFYNTKAYGTYFEYDFSSFLIVLLVFLASSSLFAGEKETGMLRLLRSTPKGRRSLCFAKQGALMIFTFVVSLLFFLCDFLVFLWCIRLRGITNPIYCIEAFEYSPLVMSIGEFMGLSWALKYFGFVLLGLVSCIFSSAFDKSYMVFVSDFAVLLGLMFLSAYSNTVLDYINIINPVNLLISRKMFEKFSVLNFFGTPVFTYAVNISMAAVLFIALTAVLSTLNNENGKAKRWGA